MNTMTTLAFVTALTSFVSSCGGRGGDRQEEINSLRTFGIASAPVISTPSDDAAAPHVVILTIHAAVPLGQTAAITPFVDSAKGSALALPASAIVIQAGSEQYEAHNKYQLFTAKAAIAVPTLALLHAVPANFKGGQLRYGLTITSGTEHENVIGDIIVMPAGAPETAWAQPTIDIAEPLDAESVSTSADITLKAAIGNTNSESLKVGWFVSDGQVTNRRAAETVWKLSSSGPQTLAVVVHGVRSRGFAMKVIDVAGN